MGCRRRQGVRRGKGRGGGGRPAASYSNKVSGGGGGVWASGGCTACRSLLLLHLPVSTGFLLARNLTRPDVLARFS